jgi:hypothetical protein
LSLRRIELAAAPMAACGMNCAIPDPAQPDRGIHGVGQRAERGYSHQATLSSHVKPLQCGRLRRPNPRQTPANGPNAPTAIGPSTCSHDPVGVMIQLTPFVHCAGRRGGGLRRYMAAEAHEDDLTLYQEACRKLGVSAQQDVVGVLRGDHNGTPVVTDAVSGGPCSTPGRLCAYDRPSNLLTDHEPRTQGYCPLMDIHFASCRRANGTSRRSWASCGRPGSWGACTSRGAAWARTARPSSDTPCQVSTHLHHPSYDR